MWGQVNGKKVFHNKRRVSQGDERNENYLIYSCFQINGKEDEETPNYFSIVLAPKLSLLSHTRYLKLVSLYY